MRKTATFVMAAVGLGLAGGCVYYNTFYLARRNYERAEDLRQQAEAAERPVPREADDAYRKSLEFASKVLADHPDSKWVEEALLLSQMVLLRQGSHAASVRKAFELEENFPESPLLPESRLYLARGRLAMGEAVEAAHAADLAIAELDGALHAEARLVRGKALAQAGREEEAAMVFAELAADPDIPRQVSVDARLEDSRMLEARGDHEAAARAMDSILADESLRRTVRTEALLRRIDMLLEAGEQEEAEADLKTLEGLDETRFYAGIIRYYRGLLMAERGDPRRGQSELVFALRDGVTAEWEARIRISLAALLEETGSLSSAVPEYRAVVQGPGTPEQKQEAADRMGAILRLYALRSLATKLEASVSFPDPRQDMRPAGGVDRRAQEAAARRRSVREVEVEEQGQVRPVPPAEEIPSEVTAEDVPPGLYLYLLAEHWTLEMGRPDSARTYADLLLRDHPSSELVPQLLYAMTGWPVPEERKAWAADRLHADHPDSRWTYRHDVGQSISTRAPDEISAERAFQQAEQRIDPLAGPEEWAQTLPGLFEIAEQYPRSEWAAQALLTAGWLIERGAAGPDSARTVYERVASEYPGTKQARHASERLSGPSEGAQAPDPLLVRQRALEVEVDGWSTWFSRMQAAQVTRLQPNALQDRSAAQTRQVGQPDRRTQGEVRTPPPRTTGTVIPPGRPDVP